jgi:hypothetical protein
LPYERHAEETNAVKLGSRIEMRNIVASNYPACDDYFYKLITNGSVASNEAVANLFNFSGVPEIKIPSCCGLA